jgi:hypothetical protein
MTLDELLLEWSYRSEKGYPSMGSPSDISVLKGILRELKLPEWEINELIDNLEEDNLTTTGTDGMEDSSVEKEKEKEKQVQTTLKSKEEPESEKITKELLLKLVQGIDINNMSDNALKILYDRISNFSSYKPILKTLGNKKFKVSMQKTYAKEIQDVIENLGPEQQKKFIEYLDNPDKHINFPESNTGNLYDTVPSDIIPKTLVTNILKHTSTDDRGRGVGMGELGMALIFKNVEAPIASKGDLSINGKEFEIKGNGASLGATPDVIFKRTKALKYWEPLEAFGLYFGDGTTISKYIIKDKEGKEIQTLNLLNQFPEAVAVAYKKTDNTGGFKEAFKNFLIIGGELSSPYFDTVFNDIDLSNSDSIHKTIAYLNVVRYIALEGFEHFMAHDMGAGGGNGTYIYAQGSPTDIVNDLKKGGAKFERVAYNNLRPRIGFKSDMVEEIIPGGNNNLVMTTFN